MWYQDWTEYTTDILRVCKVDGAYLRLNVDPDFTEGANDMARDWMPARTIYIEEADPVEMKCWLIHEANERTLMSGQGLIYEDAHNASNRLENEARANPGSIDEVLKKVLSDANKQAEVKRMPNMIRKNVTCEIREVADRTLEFIGSTETKDRMGDVVKANGWDLSNYVKNPVFMWAHDYKQPPIGKAVKVWVSEGKLMFRIQFAEKDTYDFADTIYKLYKGGFLNATSVGFAPRDDGIKTIEGGGNEYSNQELLELSGVPIPANPEALTTARSQGLITVKELRTFKKVGELENAISVMSSIGAELHNKSKKPVSQDEIKDEIDYLVSMIDEAGLSDEAKKAASELIKRVSGGDTPVDIKAMSGKAQQAIKDAMDACDKADSLMDTHHKAHGDSYKNLKDLIKSEKDGLGGLLPPPQMPMDPEMEPDEDDKALLEELALSFDLSRQKITGGH